MSNYKLHSVQQCEWIIRSSVRLNYTLSLSFALFGRLWEYRPFQRGSSRRRAEVKRVSELHPLLWVWGAARECNWSLDIGARPISMSLKQPTHISFWNKGLTEKWRLASGCASVVAPLNASVRTEIRSRWWNRPLNTSRNEFRAIWGHRSFDVYRN